MMTKIAIYNSILLLSVKLLLLSVKLFFFCLYLYDKYIDTNIIKLVAIIILKSVSSLFLNYNFFFIMC